MARSCWWLGRAVGCHFRSCWWLGRVGGYVVLVMMARSC